jgi:hypothetical protein
MPRLAAGGFAIATFAVVLVVVAASGAPPRVSRWRDLIALTRRFTIGLAPAPVAVPGDCTQRQLPETEALKAAPEPQPQKDESRRMSSALRGRAGAPRRRGAGLATQVLSRTGELLATASTPITKVLRRKAAAGISWARGRLFSRRGTINFCSGRHDQDEPSPPAAAAVHGTITMTKVAPSF